MPDLSSVNGPVVLDGRTQTAFGGDLNPFGPEIVLDGNGLQARGIVVATSNHAVFGLNIQRFGFSGLWISAGDNNWIAGNYIGTDPTGTVAAGNSRWGVVLDGGASNNLIGTNSDGTDDVAERNILSSNGIGGVGIADPLADHNVVAGNFIGTNATGTAAIPNANRGVDISSGAQHNRIGTNSDSINDAAEGNVISGNAEEGIGISDAGTSHNLIAGNFIGTDATGTLDLGNGFRGVVIFNAATLNTIGGTVAAAQNIISGNNTGGVRITGAGSSNNLVMGNYIGTRFNGAGALPNSRPGVQLEIGATSNVIGTNGDGQSDATEGNLISGNSSAGVRITGVGTSQNVVAGNYIGTTAAGNAALPNTAEGVIIISAATNNRVGTNGDGVSDAAERNVVSGNAVTGVRITGAGTSFKVAAGNYIGTDATGSVALDNGNHGASFGSL